MQGKRWWPCWAWWFRLTCPAHSLQCLQQTQCLARSILMVWLLSGVSQNNGRDWLPARPEDQDSLGLALKGHPAPELMVAMTKDYPSDVIYGSAAGGNTQGDSCLSIRPPAGRKKGFVQRQDMKRDVRDGNMWQTSQGNIENHTETLLEDGTRECIVLRVKKASLGSERCCSGSCMTSHMTFVVCLHSDLSLILKFNRH